MNKNGMKEYERKKTIQKICSRLTETARLLRNVRKVFRGRHSHSSENKELELQREYFGFTFKILFRNKKNIYILCLSISIKY